jgi:hypothetical protein
MCTGVLRCADEMWKKVCVIHTSESWWFVFTHARPASRASSCTRRAQTSPELPGELVDEATVSRNSTRPRRILVRTHIPTPPSRQCMDQSMLCGVIHLFLEHTTPTRLLLSTADGVRPYSTGGAGRHQLRFYIDSAFMFRHCYRRP